ncbi:transposase (plasmid) [Sinorhizobium meliloti SM11]|uniref:Transposase n=2 Tax=Rhizobium meliloti TaxID=382 RepID=Q92ZK7_RHIME|nr:transposase, fragment [Sinorhizobium meliloti 1021]AEH82181.1 transposase [Sinorhizobium meliloti SM11]
MALHRTGKADVRHGYVERCNGRMRDELLNESLFFGLSHASRAISKWSTTAIRSGRTRRSDTAPRQPILGSSPQPSQLVYRKRSRL